MAYAKLVDHLETIKTFRGDTNMTSTLKELGGGKPKMRCYRTLEGERLASVLEVQSLFFLLKKIVFAS